jgi:hypothetical protein
MTTKSKTIIMNITVEVAHTDAHHVKLKQEPYLHTNAAMLVSFAFDFFAGRIFSIHMFSTKAPACKTHFKIISK